MRQPDAYGRIPLSMREYDAIRTVFGAVNALDQETLKERLQLTKSGWRDMRLCAVTMHRVLQALLDTVPLEKLISMKAELRDTVCEVRLKAPSSVPARDCVYVPREAMVALINRAIHMDCVLCEKSLKEGRKCPLYKNISACFPYDLDEVTDNLCPFAGVSRLNCQKE